MAENENGIAKMLQSGVLPAPACFERLFLLELMVHEVCYDCAVSMDQNFLQTLGATCIAFNSDSFPPLEMSEDEFGVRPPFESFKVKFKSGKSCLFALKRGAESLVSDKAQITVSRRLPPGGCSPEYTFGKAYLKMSPDFLSVLSSNSNISKCLKVSLDILNCSMENRGSIAIFLRLSCFGKTIITQFQADSASDSKSFSFRGDDIANASIGNNAPPQMTPQGQMPMQNLPPNVSEAAKEELIIDLLRVIKSSAMLSNLLNVRSIPYGDQILSTPGIPNANSIYRTLAYNEHLPEPNYQGTFGYNNFMQFPQPIPSKTRIPQNNLMTTASFPNPNVTYTFGCQSGYPEPFVTNTVFQSVQPENNPVNINRMLTYEPKGALNATVSENVLCKPEWRSKNANTSQLRAMVNASPSRTSIKLNAPSKSAWYSPGPSEDVMYKRV